MELQYFNRNINIIFFFEIIFHLLVQLTGTCDAKGLIRNDQLCPDPNMNGNRQEKMYFVNNNMPVISIPVYRVLLGSVLGIRQDIPCNFIDVTNYASRTNLVQLSIQAIQLSDTPWNFTGARDCSAFVKFRVQDRNTLNDTKLCRMYKTKSLEIQHQNTTHPPSIWMLPGKKLGFLVPELQLNTNESYSNGNETKFLQIVYKTYYDNSCVFKVQQYMLNPSQPECDRSSIKHRLCGTYNCSEQHEILKNLGFYPFDVVVNSDGVIGTFDRSRNRGKFFALQDNMDTYEIIRGDGFLMIRPRGRNTSFHAALFSGMTRAISFLFILSILISCISYQLKPYLRPSSSYENDLARERSHENHRRCYRRPPSQTLPFHRSPVEEIPMEHTAGGAGSSPCVYVTRPSRSRGYFHHTCHRNRSVGAAPSSDLPSYNNQVLEQYCQPPPSYESIQPPTYDETIIQTRTDDTQVVIGNGAVGDSTNNPNKTEADAGNNSRKIGEGAAANKDDSVPENSTSTTTPKTDVSRGDGGGGGGSKDENT